MLRSAFKRWKRPGISTTLAGYADPAGNRRDCRSIGVNFV
jgi:hypothetical protein